MDRREWSGLILEQRYEMGTAAQKNRGRYTGTKTHRLYCEYVVGLTEAPRPGTVGARFQATNKPVLFICRPSCGSTSGQYAGMPTTATEITCEKCK